MLFRRLEQERIRYIRPPWLVHWKKETSQLLHLIGKEMTCQLLAVAQPLLGQLLAQERIRHTHLHDECHSEGSEESRRPVSEILRYPQNDIAPAPVGDLQYR